ncbi:hypothetical protein BKP37_12840 [Anaerobacillus alkalilacustris]|uniref:dUTPase n=1 Tax=Anaerobacillus alkalilacustris TaxID=393763 RepID=A0A1S2LJJ1_9BACI|nr:dUTP diphosphatase [Anaerobacillus alkalilacustris]OIJ12682.1 hypothetical protein BKP37_12840 [Anaerobacillus alkalilacustris]
MNIKKLFEVQKILDDRITKEHSLEGYYLIPEKTLALQVELGELANEWRGFKFWSKDQSPRIKVAKRPSMNYDDIEWHNPLLEEYVDCLHFLLSIGLELGFHRDAEVYLVKITDPIQMFSKQFQLIIQFEMSEGRQAKQNYYYGMLSQFLGLRKSLRFTWEQIEQAYLEKNKINHDRQATGY